MNVHQGRRNKTSWYHLGSPVPHSIGLTGTDIPWRCNGRSRRGLCGLPRSRCAAPRPSSIQHAAPFFTGRGSLLLCTGCTLLFLAFVVFHCCLSIYTKTEGLSSTNFPAVGRLRSHWMDGCRRRDRGCRWYQHRQGRKGYPSRFTYCRTDRGTEARQSSRANTRAAGAPKRKRMLPWGSAAPARPAKAATRASKTTKKIIM